MSEWHAVACTREQSVLGEGVRWDSRRNELLRVDIEAGRVYRDRVGKSGDLVAVRTYELPDSVGAVAPVDGDDGWLLAAGRGFVHLSADGRSTALAEVAPEGARMNDGACDPQGRFWAGTKAHDNRPGAAALFRLDLDGRTELMLGGLTISNGLGWSPDGGTMYLADTIPGVIHAFSFNGGKGTISEGRVLVDLTDEAGRPDGLTVDSEGYVWVALFGGSAVRRYSGEGVLVDELPVPAEQVTSCAFAGLGLTRLYVTTATEGWSDEQRRADPAAGLVYRFETEVSGRPAAPFRPDRHWWAAIMAGEADLAP